MRPSRSLASVLLLPGLLLLGALPGLALARQDAGAVPAADALAEAAPDPATAIDPALYRAEVELLSQGASERRAAAARGLLQVVVRLTGDPDAGSQPAIRRAMGMAQAYVDGEAEAIEASDSPGNTAIGGAPVYKANLVIPFNPSAVDALVAASGLKLWRGERPRPILWLAIDDGRGARLVTAAQINVVKPLAQRGLDRGLRFGLPAGSAVESAAVQTVWDQNPGPMQALTARYGNDSQLLGRVYRAGNGWTADWVLTRAGTELGRWSYSDPSPQQAIASGADGAANAIAARDAVRIDAGDGGRLLAEVTGLRSTADYTRVMGYLQALAVVSDLSVVEARPDALRVELQLAVGREAFEGFLAAGGTLVADPLAPPDAPSYRLQP